MSKEQYALVLDAGTTGVKAFVFDSDYKILARSYRKIKEMDLRNNYVEQDPRKILEVAQDLVREAVKESKIEIEKIKGLAITNQRETTVAWDKTTSWPLYPAISWKDERTKKYCDSMSEKYASQARGKTGLVIAPYFSASKINWLLNNVAAVKAAARNKMLACGTLDAWLLWNISEERSFLTEYTNASRTLLFNIRKREWDQDLFDFFEIPSEIMPEVVATRSCFGNLKKDIIGRNIPITAMCGDQQASLYAAGKGSGTTKITYGTGTFIMQILGKQFSLEDDFFTTLSADGDFVLEAKIKRGGREVEHLLNNSEKLRDFLKNLAQQADIYVRKLPQKPREIIIDGGVMRDGILKKYQEEVSHVPVKEQVIFDGTALGGAKLVLEG